MAQYGGISSRLRAAGFSRTQVIAGALGPAVGAAVICVFLRVPIDRNFGISGGVFAISTFVFTQFQAQGPRARRVYFIPKSASPFSSTVFRGFSNELTSNAALNLTVDWPTDADVEVSELEWQLAKLASRTALEADAIVLVPATDDEALWNALAQLARGGVFVLAIDTKPTNAIFSAKGAPRPCFVGSDFSVGGDLVGSEIARRLDATPSLRAIVAAAPHSSWPGQERTRGIVTGLFERGLQNRSTYVQLPDWGRDSSARLLFEAIQAEFDSRPETELVVFCGNDKILDAVERLLYREFDNVRSSRISLIGYDGATLTDGSLQVSASNLAVGTVDTRPEEQGKEAARILLDEHHGILAARGSVYVDPALVAVNGEEA